MATSTISYSQNSQNENEMHLPKNPPPTPNPEPEEIPNPYATGEFPIGAAANSYGAAPEFPTFNPYPQNTAQAYLDTFQAVLQSSLGEYVVIEFLIGTSNLTEKSGLLYAVGNNFVTLYDIKNGQYIVCDLFSVKFVTIYYNQSPYSMMGSNSTTEGGMPDRASERYPANTSSNTGNMHGYAPGGMMPNGMRLRNY